MDYFKYPVTVANIPSAERHRRMLLTHLISLQLPAIKHSELRREWTVALQTTAVQSLTQRNACDLHSVRSLLDARDGPLGTMSMERVTDTA